MGMTASDRLLYQVQRTHYGEAAARQSYQGRIGIANAGGVVGPESGSVNPNLPVFDTLKDRPGAGQAATCTPTQNSAPAPEADRFSR